MLTVAQDDLLLPAESFSGGLGTAEERLEAWRACVAGPLDVQIDDFPLPADWVTRTTGWNLDSMMVVRGDFGPQTLVRRASHFERDGLDPYVLHLNMSEHAMRFHAYGHRVTVEPGQLLLSDFAQPRTLFCHGDILTVFVSRASLDALLPRQFDLHGIQPGGACAVLLASHLRSLCTHLPRISRSEAPDARIATVQLLAASLSRSLDMLGLARPTTDPGLLTQIRKYVDEHLADEDLTTETICERFRLSRSSLFRLFEREGGVVHYLQDRRLLRIHALLRSNQDRIYLGRIASDHGFKSATHFSRAYREVRLQPA